MVEKHKVLIMRCESYDAEKIAGIIKEGMEKLNAIPSGNILASFLEFSVLIL